MAEPANMSFMARISSICLVLVSLFHMAGAALGDAAEGHAPIAIDFFFEAGCESCATVRSEVLPELENRYAGHYVLRECDIGEKTNYLKLVAYQDRFKVHDNEPVSMVVDGNDYLSGVDRIKQGLFAVLDAALARRIDKAIGTNDTACVTSGAPSDELIRRRVGEFTFVGVIGAAVVDSINPCAISTLVFFMSVLSVAHIGVRRMALAGISFLAACFIAYIGIGFGLLRILQFLTAWHWVKEVVDIGLIALMGTLAVFSFRDAYRYHKSGQATDVSIKLPDAIQERIHRVLRNGMHKRSLIIGGFGAGVAVTLLESICTGQVYVPALVMVLKSGQSLLRCAAYLILYNLIFILPLAIVLGLTCGGLSTPSLIGWSRRNVVISKSLIGLFFIGMSLLMLVL